MTTFTTEDKENAYNPGLSCVTPSSATGLEVDLVAEAPYHPGYEDAVIEKPRPNYHEHEETLAKEINELFKVKNRHIATSKKIVEFIKNGNV